MHLRSLILAVIPSPIVAVFAPLNEKMWLCWTRSLQTSRPMQDPQGWRGIFHLALKHILALHVGRSVVLQPSTMVQALSPPEEAFVSCAKNLSKATRDDIHNQT